MNIISTEGKPLTVVPGIDDVNPVGSQILFEKLTAQELQSSTLHIPDSAVAGGPPQGYILKIGPKTVPEEWGFKVGDRVVLIGNYTPVPTQAGNREWGVIEPHQIKAVLVEDD